VAGEATEVSGSPTFSANGSNSPGSSYRWVILALLWLLYAAFGLVSRSIFPLVTPILADLNLSNAQMGFILGSWQLTYIPAALVAGALLDRWGARKSLLLGAAVMGLSAVLRYFPHGFGTMLVMVALFGAGGPMISIGGPKTIAEWFVGQSRGTAVGIYMVGPGVGGLLALSMTNSLVMPALENSWRLTFVAYGLLTLTVGSVWWVLARDTAPTASAERAGIVEVFRGLSRVRDMQVLLAMALSSFAIMHGLGSWLPRILELRGLSPAAAGLAASIPLATSIPALLIIPRLIPRFWRGRFIAWVALVTAINILVVVQSSGAVLLSALILLGVASSCFMPLMLLILMDNRKVGPKYMGSAGGMFFCVAEIGGFGGPVVMGALVDVTGTFLIGAYFCVGLCVAILVLAKLLQQRPD
jgi:cyanate permease